MNARLPFFMRRHHRRRGSGGEGTSAARTPTPPKAKIVPGVLYDSHSRTQTGPSSNARGSPRTPDHVTLPTLRCPGGPRINAEGIKNLYKVPHAGYLAKYDHRFVLNLKLTHQLASYLSRTTLRSSDKVLLELGPGAGAMTRSLLTRPCVGVLGVEKDERFNAHLEQIRNYTHGKFQWCNADILHSNEVTLLRRAFPQFVAHRLRRGPGEGAGAGAGTAASSGYEGAPLRTVARERLLRDRYRCQQHPSQHESDKEAQHGRRTCSSHHAYNEHVQQAGGLHDSRTSPNPAFDITDHWWADGDAKVEVIANLPFDIITELLMRYAVDCSRMSGLFSFGRVPLHIFTQMEVAERIAAAPGSIHFSRLSVLCQCYFHVRLKQSFTEMTYYPRTEVLGALLTLEPRTRPLQPGLDGATLIHFTDLLMKPGQRGMTVSKALLKFVPAEVAQYVLQEIRMDGAMKVLDLTVQEVTQMAALWQRFLAASQQATHAASEGGRRRRLVSRTKRSLFICEWGSFVKGVHMCAHL